MPSAERVQKRRGVVLWGEVRGWLLTWSPPHSITCRQLVTEQITLRLRLFQKWDCLPGSESEQKERICPVFYSGGTPNPRMGDLTWVCTDSEGRKRGYSRPWVMELWRLARLEALGEVGNAWMGRCIWT